MLDIKLPDYQITEFHKEMERIMAEDAEDVLTEPGAGIRFSATGVDAVVTGGEDIEEEDLAPAGNASGIRRRVDK